MEEQSDFLIYKNIAELQFKDKKTNDLAYIYQMSRTKPKCLIDRGDELQLFKDNYKNKIPFCNPCTSTRGGNYQGCEPLKECPKPEYQKYFLNEFLLTPCPKPTHMNYINCNEEKCCSIRHQLFKNQTKRKIPIFNKSS